MQCPSTSKHWNWYSFRRPRKDDRLSQPPGVLIQQPPGLELRTLGSQAATLTTEPTPGLCTDLTGIQLECGQSCWQYPLVRALIADPELWWRLIPSLLCFVNIAILFEVVRAITCWRKDGTFLILKHLVFNLTVADFADRVVLYEAVFLLRRRSLYLLRTHVSRSPLNAWRMS